MMLDYSGNSRQHVVWLKGTEGRLVNAGNVATPSRALVSGWFNSKWATFIRGVFACSPDNPGHLLITFPSKHTHVHTQMTLAAEPINFCLSFSQSSPKTLDPSKLLAVFWPHNNDSLPSKRAFQLSRHFCICGSMSDPLIWDINTEW